MRHQISVLGGTVKFRAELLERKLLNTNVYKNAAGFLRIQSQDEEQAEGFDPFDATRIHPECYASNEWAQKICADALEDNYYNGYNEIVFQLRKNVR